MLEIRPNCEWCDKDLPADAADACICTYECTFCRDCVDSVLENVCPNCGGGFCDRPIRPQVPRRAGISLSHQPMSDKRVNSKYSLNEIKQFTGATKATPVSER